MEERFAIAAFRSRLQVMQLVTALRRMGIQASVVTTPRSIALGCGLSARFAPEHVQTARNALQAQQQGNLIGFYMVTRQPSGKITCERIVNPP